MKRRNLKNKKTAFTIIEMIIYIAIIGIVLSGFVSYSLSVSGVKNKNSSVVAVQANARTALQIISRKIHEAEAVITPTVSATSTALVLDMPGVNPNITFSVLNGILLMNEAGIATTTITNTNTFITNLIYTNLSPVGDRANIKIDLDIKYNVASGDVQFGYSKKYRTAVSTRI